jgi:hypothetical protein
VLCPSCARREQGPDGFCDVCDVIRAVENYRYKREDELVERRIRWANWVGATRRRYLQEDAS